VVKADSSQDIALYLTDSPHMRGLEKVAVEEENFSKGPED